MTFSEATYHAFQYDEGKYYKLALHVPSCPTDSSLTVSSISLKGSDVVVL